MNEALCGAAWCELARIACPLSLGTMASCSHATKRPAESRRLTLRAHPRRVALVGQPNVGKSALFGRLTGLYATVSNYPGTTVTLTRGRVLLGGEVCDVIDTPGVNALQGVLSEDEMVAREVLSDGQADVIVQVADARNLRRALMLTWQMAAFGKPMVLALNMVDEARACGIDVDAASLATEVGFPVIETVATEGRGLPELRTQPGAGATRAPIRRGQRRRRAAWAHDRPSGSGASRRARARECRSGLGGDQAARHRPADPRGWSCTCSICSSACSAPRRSSTWSSTVVSGTSSIRPRSPSRTA